MTAVQVNTLFGSVNFLFAIIGVAMLNWYGRRTLMLASNAVECVAMFGLGIALLTKCTVMSVICMFTFVFAFEFGSGPVAWIYMAEVLHDKGMSLATVVNWVCTFTISSVTTLIIAELGEDNTGYFFVGLGFIILVGWTFQFVYMKETMGLTPEELANLFVNERELDEAKKDDDFMGVDVDMEMEMMAMEGDPEGMEGM